VGRVVKMTELGLGEGGLTSLCTRVLEAVDCVEDTYLG
jgi:hypothetical protein